MILSCRYESTSSDESSSESSDEGSDSSEYHEAREKLPESAIQHQQVTHNEVSQPPESNTVPQQTAVVPNSQPSPVLSAPVDTGLLDKPPRSLATDTALQNCASQPLASGSTFTPANDPDSKVTVDQPTEKPSVSQEITLTSSSTESAPEQSSIKSSVNCSSSLCVTKTTEITKQQYTVQSEAGVLPGQSELKPPANDAAKVAAKQVRYVYSWLTLTDVALELLGLFMSISDRYCLLVHLRPELSDSLISALHTLQKALGEPNAFSQQGAVSVHLLSVKTVSRRSRPVLF